MEVEFVWQPVKTKEKTPAQSRAAAEARAGEAAEKGQAAPDRAVRARAAAKADDPLN